MLVSKIAKEQVSVVLSEMEEMSYLVAIIDIFYLAVIGRYLEGYPPL